MKQHDALDNACGVIACLHAVYNTAAGATLPAESILARHLATASALDPAARVSRNLTKELNNFFLRRPHDIGAESLIVTDLAFPSGPVVI